MVIDEDIVKLLVRAALIAEARTISSVLVRELDNEPQMTTAFITRLQDAVNEIGRLNNIQISARNLGDRGRRAPETRYGADICSVLDVNTTKFRITKGFLLQAKIEDSWIRINRNGFLKTVTFSNITHGEFERLKGQIDDMLHLTKESFVIVYSNREFVVIPATSIMALRAGATVYAMSIRQFFTRHFRCFIGDPQLNSHEDSALDQLLDRMKGKTNLVIEIHEHGGQSKLG